MNFVINVSEIKNVWEDRPIAVLGGGPSLVEGLKKLPEQVYKVSANDHAMKVTDVDMFVSLDKHKSKWLWEEVVSEHPEYVMYSTYPQWSNFLQDVPIFYAGWSGTLATSLACHMTRGEVIILGMDLYQGDQCFFWSESGEGGFSKSGSQKSRGLERQLKAWSHIPSRMENPERISVMGGPLSVIFKEYAPN